MHTEKTIFITSGRALAAAPDSPNSCFVTPAAVAAKSTGKSRARKGRILNLILERRRITDKRKLYPSIIIITRA